MIRWWCARSVRCGRSRVPPFLVIGWCRGRPPMPLPQGLADPEKLVVLRVGADGDPQVVGDADVAQQHTGVEVLVPGRAGVAERPEQQEVRLRIDHREALVYQCSGDPAPL